MYTILQRSAVHEQCSAIFTSQCRIPHKKGSTGFSASTKTFFENRLVELSVHHKKLFCNFYYQLIVLTEAPHKCGKLENKVITVTLLTKSVL